MTNNKTNLINIRLSNEEIEKLNFITEVLKINRSDVLRFNIESLYNIAKISNKKE